jgi:hypothetical protein
MKASGLSGLCGALGALLVGCTGSVENESSIGPGTPTAMPTGPGAPSPTTTSTTPGAPSPDPTSTTPGDPGPAPTTTVTPVTPTAPSAPFAPVQAAATTRKVKGLLTGLAPTDEEIAKVSASGAAGLQELINSWMTGAEFQPLFRDKMLFFFRNVFQQTGFTPTEDFKPQLLENGGFDFGPFGTGAVGDDVYFRMVQNIEDMFAMTAWQLLLEDKPFTDVLTTQRYMMTTALKSVYLQIEMPNDQPFAGFGRGSMMTSTVSWTLDYNEGVTIPIADAVSSLTFDDAAPATAATGPGGGGGMFTTCRGEAMTKQVTGYAQLFQRLIGYTPRVPFSANPECWEHASKPYFEIADTQDWAWVSIEQVGPTGEHGLEPYDIPALREANTLSLRLPRVGFYSTPAFLALWATNDSNQHRVTANQALIVALGESFTPDAAIIPVSTTAVDAAHSVEGSECYGCHKMLDPLKDFWGTQLDFNDRNDFPARGSFMGGAANPRPAKTGGVFAFRNVNVDKSAGGTLADVGALLASVTDNATDTPINRFAIAMTQKLCFFANSSACDEADPEFRRVASAFEQSGFKYTSLVMELFSSPLVTGASETATSQNPAFGHRVSIARRDQFCQALSNRLGKADLCSMAVPKPSSTQNNTLNIAGNIPADAFGRGSENLVTPSDPTLFFRAATEMLCEDISVQAVDAETDTIYASSDVTGAIEDMVTRIMGYPPNDPKHAPAVQILTDHNAAAKSGGANATNALRSTFAAACQSPTSVSFGL